MKLAIRLGLTVSLFSSIALYCCVSSGMAQDLAALSPKTCKVLEENDQVRILEVWDKPGDIEPLHSHPAYVSVVLSDAKIKVTTPDGKVVEKDYKAGKAAYKAPTTHTVENVGTTDFHVIVVELKK